MKYLQDKLNAENYLQRLISGIVALSKDLVITQNLNERVNFVTCTPDAEKAMGYIARVSNPKTRKSECCWFIEILY